MMTSGCGTMRRLKLVMKSLMTPLFAALSIPGCVAADDAPRQTAADTPVGARVTTMWLATTPPQDSDGNGCPDLIDVSMYLFAEPHPIPLQQPGTLLFKLVSASGEELASWQLAEEAVASGSASLPAGPGYLFRLNILDRGSDKLPRQQAEILATFTGRDGTVVRQRSSTFKVGKVGI
ncbi:MAG: hypothetical protein ACK54H_02635 [Phycisphaerales bacterium]|jgi:hypothetical protein